MKISEEAIIICKILTNHGFEAYLVGGYIRDKLLGKTPKDIDVATNATPTEVYASFINRYYVAPTGEKFGTVSIVEYFTNKVLAEVTTYRSEGRYSDGRHPDNIKYEKDPKKDLARRDFTMNAIAYNLLEHKFVDPFNGMLHIKNRLIVSVGNPEERFKEDPLRMMRMCRFAATLNFDVEGNTEKAARKLHHLIANISAERVRDELIKILLSDNPRRGIGYLRRTKILQVILPKLDKLQGVFQPPQHHRFDVYNHSIETAQILSKQESNPYLVITGLLHDVGKTEMALTSPYFKYHVDDGMKILPEILRRLKLSNKQRRYIMFLVEHHMDAFNYINNMSKRGNRRYLSKIKNLSWLGDLRCLILADVQASGYNKENELNKINLWFDALYKIINSKEPVSKKDLMVNGYDLMKLNIKPKEIGKIKSILLDIILDNPKLNTKEELIKIVKIRY